MTVFLPKTGRLFLLFLISVYSLWWLAAVFAADASNDWPVPRLGIFAGQVGPLLLGGWLLRGSQAAWPGLCKRALLLGALSAMGIGGYGISRVIARALENPPMPILASLPEFQLTDQAGQPYGSRQLRGVVWIANFFCTQCSSAAPLQTTALKTLHRQLQREVMWKDIRFINISVDPEVDTPGVLRAYAQQLAVDEPHWKFLTGPPQTIQQLRADSLKSFQPTGAEPHLGARQEENHRMCLIDLYLRIRGTYDLSVPGALDELRHELSQILDERIGEPEEIFYPPWLETRRQAQLETVTALSVYHDFSFTDRLEESGIRFHHKIVDDAGKDHKGVHYDHGNGVAIADVDGDGRYDVYFVNQAGENELWRNLGNGTFANITPQAGIAVADRIAVSASFADLDNDGDPDLYVTAVRTGNLLFENDGSGRFTDISQASGLGYQGHSSAAVFFDYDRDGLLDVFVTNIGQYTTEKIARVSMEPLLGEKAVPYEYYVGLRDAFGGHQKPERTEYSRLYKNIGNNRFVDVSGQVQLQDGGWSGAASPVDFNTDGWPDLYVLNMQGHDEYYENVAGQYFMKKSREIFPQTPWGAMGVKAFDYDNDSDMDLFVTDMHADMFEELSPEDEKRKITMTKKIESITRSQEQSVQSVQSVQSILGNALYQNQGNGTFREVSSAVGAENYWPWGLSVGDLNADGFGDVFITASMSFPLRYAVNSVLLNIHGKAFVDSEFVLGVEPRRNGRTAIPYFTLALDGPALGASKYRQHASNAAPPLVVWGAVGSRSSVLFDLDADGDLDIVTSEFNFEPMVLISNLAQKKAGLRYLQIRLIGTQSNRDGLGAVVQLQAGTHTYTQVYDGQSGYLSQSQSPLYFGLGDAASIKQIDVVWPSGTRQIVPGPLATNRTITIREESSSDDAGQ